MAEPRGNGAGTRRAQVHADIEALARLTGDPHARGVTREVFTPLYAESVRYVAGRMEEAGLSVRRDASGNLIGRWTGTDPGAPAVLTGSHIDTTLDAGRYDGVVGVLGAVAAVGDLRDAGGRPRRSIEVIAFAGEEPRFGTGCIGSRAIMGRLARADLDRLRDRDGVTLADALRADGLDPEAVGDARLDPAAVHAFVELHIEQGAVLEAAGKPIGVVTAIAAPHDLRMTLRGSATHSGATPMHLRRDALAGAAEVVLAVERLARASRSGTTVGTVGVLGAQPGAVNVVPGLVELDVDVRDIDAGARTDVVEALIAAARETAGARELELELEEPVVDEPRACSPVVVDAVRAACADLGVDYLETTSGAYHDAMVLGAEIPMGMIFVPSRGGLSHHPDEYTAPEEIEHGIAVLQRTLARLAEA